MSNNKRIRAKVTRMAPCSYRIESAEIDSAGTQKRRGIIIESEGEAVIIPFKVGNGRKRTAHKVRESEHGTLKLSAARQKITLSITFDREKDSADAFRDEFDKLIDGYVVDVIKYECDECLE